MLFAKKVREYKDTLLESEIAASRAQTLLSDLNKQIKTNFKETIRRLTKKSVRIKFGEINFGNKKNNQEAPKLVILSVNGCVASALDEGWQPGYNNTNDEFPKPPFSVKRFQEILYELSEKTGIEFSLSKE